MGTSTGYGEVKKQSVFLNQFIPAPLLKLRDWQKRPVEGLSQGQGLHSPPPEMRVVFQKPNPDSRLPHVNLQHPEDEVILTAQINSTFTTLVAGQYDDDLRLRESGFLHGSKVRVCPYFRVHRLRGSLQSTNLYVKAEICYV